LILTALAWGATPLAVYDLEADDGGFVATGETPGAWQWGEVTHGPGSGFDGAKAWSTGLDGDYLNDTTDYLEIPIPDLAGTVQPALRFVHWYDIDAGDAAWVEVDIGDGFVRVDPVYGYAAGASWSGTSGAWRAVTVDLAGLVAPRVRLAFATDLSGVASGWFVDTVGVYDGDVTAPSIAVLAAPTDTEDLDGPYAVSVTVTDDVAVVGVTLVWSAGSDGGEVAMTEGEDGAWSAEIRGQAADTTVTWRVLATDGDNQARLPERGGYTFRVYLPAPTDLVGPEGRMVGSKALLAWTPPETGHTIAGYRVYRGGAALQEADEPSALVPLLGEFDSFAVTALYTLDDGSEAEGDASDVCTVDALVPSITSLDPAEVWPGDEVRLLATGSYLLMEEGAVLADLGDGVTVAAVDVLDVDRVRLTVEVDETAASGSRNLVLVTPVGSVVDTDALEVLDADDRPRLLSIDPDAVRQGETAEAEIALVGELGGEVTVDMGAGVVVESATVDGDRVDVTFAVAVDAGIGAHAVVVDDGTRRLDGATIEVRDGTFTTRSRCAAVEGLPAGWVLGLALLLRTRRR
jgi:hypothetical protein